MANLEAVLHDWARNTDHISFLERILTDQMACNLTRQDHHWNGVHISRCNWSNGIGRAWARSDQHNTSFTCYA